MEKKKSVLIVTSEHAPLAKTGGLADVTSALADHLKTQGHDVRVVMPFYSMMREKVGEFKTVLSSMCVAMGQGEEWCAVRETTSDAGVPIYLIEHSDFFDRDGIYHDAEQWDFFDNLRRFGFLSRAALQLVLDTDFEPDIIHANDWQTALVPAYLKTWFWDNPKLGKVASVLTIHNAAYQGLYPYSEDYDWLGLNPQHFIPDIFEDYGRINLLKGGIFYADVVNTVSPTHAEEIKTPYSEFGIAPYLANKGKNFIGILNGVNPEEWSPEVDNLIPEKFSVKNMSGKAICKKELQKRFLLNEDKHIALFGVVGRLASQKGYEMIKEIIIDMLNNMHVQFVLLGSGDSRLEEFFMELPKMFPGQAGSYIGFSNELAHLVEAGSDFFLMPSIFEPCGLNQMYSQAYGTLPIVRNTGGLADTVENYNEATGEGTGYKFQDPKSESLYYTIGWAVSTYYDRRDHHNAMVRRAMEIDNGWDKAVSQYLDFYEQALNVKQNYDSSFS